LLLQGDYNVLKVISFCQSSVCIRRSRAPSIGLVRALFVVHPFDKTLFSHATAEKANKMHCQQKNRLTKAARRFFINKSAQKISTAKAQLFDECFVGFNVSSLYIIK
jgi:hypothetical protein